MPPVALTTAVNCLRCSLMRDVDDLLVDHDLADFRLKSPFYGVATYFAIVLCEVDIEFVKLRSGRVWGFGL